MKAVRDWSQSEGICFKQNEKNWCPNQSTMTYSPDLRLYLEQLRLGSSGCQGSPLGLRCLATALVSD